MTRGGGRPMVEIPFREWLQAALGVLGWTPETFWRASLLEYFAAVKGWNEAQRAESGKPAPMTRAEFEELERDDRAKWERIKLKRALQNG
jgi:hypothetical protein